MTEKTTGKVKAHTIYKTEDGKRAPGVTTIINVLNKPKLVKWANNLGLKGIDSTKFRDEKAAIGTLAHYMIECYLRKEEPDLTDYTPNQIDLAENAVLKFYAWEEENDFETLEVELPLVSELHRVGGTCDIYGKLNTKLTLIDIKTSKGIFPEMHTQVVAYKELLIENGYPVEDIRILRIGRDEDEGFEEVQVGHWDLQWRKFLACLEIYNIDKELRRK